MKCLFLPWEKGGPAFTLDLPADPVNVCPSQKKASLQGNRSASWGGKGHCMVAMRNHGVITEPEPVASAWASTRPGQSVHPRPGPGQAGRDLCPSKRPQRMACGFQEARSEMVPNIVRGPDFWGKGVAREGPIESIAGEGVTQTQHVPSAWKCVSSPTKDSQHPSSTSVCWMREVV